MEQQKNERIDSFKQLLGDAMLLGMQLADSSYKGGIGDARNAALADGMERMRESIGAFLNVNSLKDVTPEEVLPFSQTIREIVESRG